MTASFCPACQPPILHFRSRTTFLSCPFTCIPNDCVRVSSSTKNPFRMAHTGLSISNPSHHAKKRSHNRCTAVCEPTRHNQRIVPIPTHQPSICTFPSQTRKKRALGIGIGEAQMQQSPAQERKKERKKCSSARSPWALQFFQQRGKFLRQKVRRSEVPTYGLAEKKRNGPVERAGKTRFVPGRKPPSSRLLA